MATGQGRDSREFRRNAAILKREAAPLCHICGHVIDKSLHWNDDWAWTVDHVTPLADGGHPTDLSNMAPAHRVCNSKKGKGRTIERPKQSRVWR